MVAALTSQRPKVLFIAGSDTDVGKTYTGCLMAQQFRHSGIRVGVYKPVASGCVDQDGHRHADDAQRLWEAAGRPRDLDAVCPQRFLKPLAPNLAAHDEGRVVDEQRLITGASDWFGQCEVLIVEGAGGLLSPLSDQMLNIDLALALTPMDLIIVVANRLGAIHQALASCAASTSRNLVPKGIILNQVRDADESVQTNAREIAKYTTVPVIAQLRHHETDATILEPFLRTLI